MNQYEIILSFLRKNNIQFQQISHKPVYTSEQAAKVRGLSMHEGAKSILLKTKNNFVLVVMPGDVSLDSKKLKKILGVKDIRFAKPDEVEQQMKCKVGSCYPFGSLVNLNTYMDESLTKTSKISLNPARHDVSLVVTTGDYLVLEKPTVVDIGKSWKYLELTLVLQQPGLG